MKLTLTGTGGVICTNEMKFDDFVQNPFAKQLDQHSISTNISHKIVVSVKGSVRQAQFIMDEVLNNSSSLNMCDGDANCDQDHPNGHWGAPDHDAAVHVGQDCV